MRMHFGFGFMNGLEKLGIGSSCKNIVTTMIKEYA